MPTKTRIKGTLGHQGVVDVSGMDNEMKRTLGLPVSKPKEARKKAGLRYVPGGVTGRMAEKLNQRKGKKSR